MQNASNIDLAYAMLRLWGNQAAAMAAVYAQRSDSYGPWNEVRQIIDRLVNAKNAYTAAA